MSEKLLSRVAAVASNRADGASGIAAQVIAILADGVAEGGDLAPLARALVQAQPSMAPVWNLVRHALAAAESPTVFQDYVNRVVRAPRTLVREAVTFFRPQANTAPFRVVTLSASGTVLRTLTALAEQQRLEVACAEGHPALEGRRMAASLAASGVAVTHYSDAALGQALDTVDVVMVGADAVSPDWFLNKSGTRLLAAAAAHQGIPVYVCATRDKFVSRSVAARLTIREEAASEIWQAPPAGITVRNRYFETVPLDLVTAVISDFGVLGAALVPDACSSAHDDLLLTL